MKLANLGSEARYKQRARPSNHASPRNGLHPVGPPAQEHDHERHARHHEGDGDVPDRVDSLFGYAFERRVGEIVLLEHPEPGR